MKKIVLYLDWEAVLRVRAALKRLPGGDSLSSLISAQLPPLAAMLEGMATAYEAQNAQMFADVFTDLTDDFHQQAIEMRKAVKGVSSTPPEKPVSDVRASKPKRNKKAV